jgi:hypothetical protein
MKNYIQLIALILFTGFFSCNKQVDYEAQDLNSDDVGNYKYTEKIILFSADSLTYAELLIKSDDSELFDFAKKSLHVVTSDSLNIEDINNTPYAAITSNSEIEMDYKKIYIDILNFNSNKRFTGVTFRASESTLKSQIPWLYMTEIKNIIEDKTPYLYVQYKHIATDSYGIHVEFAHKDCWLCSWEWPLNTRFHMHEAYEHLQVVANPWNNVKEVYKLGFRVTTNRLDNDNWYYWISTRPY